MLILNATTIVKTVMTDRCELVTIKPGEVSTLIVASRNLIISAMNLGSPQEVGIIISGSYEMDIAKTISGSSPYLYTDEMEAKAKLLDASIDYKGTLNASKINAQNEEIIKIKDQEIAKLKAQLIDAEDRVQKSSEGSSELRHSYDKKITSLETALEKASTERDRLKSQLTESQDQVRDYNEKVNLLQAQLGQKTQELTSALSRVEELSTSNQSTEELTDELMKIKGKVQELESEVASLTEKLKDEKEATKGWKKGCEEHYNKVQELTTSLKESTEIIENMKAEFNKACEKFQITKDENGEWIQLSE